MSSRLPTPWHRDELGGKSRPRMHITEVHELRERALGSVEDHSFADAMAESWKNFDLAYPGGESNLAAQERVLRLVLDLARRHSLQTVVLATHGNLLDLLLNAFDPSVGFEFWRTLEFPDAFELRLSSSSEGVFRRVVASGRRGCSAPIHRNRRRRSPR